MAVVVVDASAVVELLRRSPTGRAVEARLRGGTGAAPAHLDAEVLSAPGRLARAGDLREGAVSEALRRLTAAPFPRYPVPPLLSSPWSLRTRVALPDALYVVLAQRLGAPLLTTDDRFRRAGAPHLTVVLPGSAA